MTKAKTPIPIDMMEAAMNKDPLFALVTDLESPIAELQNRVRIMFALPGDMDEDDGMIMFQLGRDVEAVADKLSDIHKQLFRMTHPNPAIRAKGNRQPHTAKTD